MLHIQRRTTRRYYSLHWVSGLMCNFVYQVVPLSLLRLRAMCSVSCAWGPSNAPMSPQRILSDRNRERKRKVYSLLLLWLLTMNNLFHLQCHITWFQSIDPLHIMGMQPIWRTKQKKFSLLGIEIYSHAKNLIVLSFRLASFPRTCKGSIEIHKYIASWSVRF